MKKIINIIAIVVIIASFIGINLYGSETITNDDIFGGTDFVFNAARNIVVLGEILLWVNLLQLLSETKPGRLHRFFVLCSLICSLLVVILGLDFVFRGSIYHNYRGALEVGLVSLSAAGVLFLIIAFVVRSRKQSEPVDN